MLSLLLWLLLDSHAVVFAAANNAMLDEIAMIGLYRADAAFDNSL